MYLMSMSSAYANDPQNDPQADTGWYLRGNAGYGVHTDADLTGGIDSSQHGNGLQSEGNVAYSVGGGYDFGDHWRLELDADSLDASLGSISQTPSSNGSLKTESLMLNALYDFDNFGKFEPYIGAGLGFVRGNADFAAHDFPGVENELVRNPTCVGERSVGQASSCAISASDDGFGWQLLAGIGYKISENLTWDTHYTYLNGPDLDLDGHIANGNTGAFSLFDAELDNVGAHTVMTGLRYRFGKKDKPIDVTDNFDTPDRKIIERLEYCPPPYSHILKRDGCPTSPPPLEYCNPPFSHILKSDGCPTPLEYCDPPFSHILKSDGCPEYCPPPSPYSDRLITDPRGCDEIVIPPKVLNECKISAVKIFSVDVNTAPKQLSRLGTLPQFGDSQGLTPTQFYEKLDKHYNASAEDKAYLNHLFKSMGYNNGWDDAQPYMFTSVVLPVNTKGLMGFGKEHHYSYSILPSAEIDRQAFEIQSANGVVVHFMKSCGNYFYACE